MYDKEKMLEETKTVKLHLFYWHQKFCLSTRDYMFCFGAISCNLVVQITINFKSFYGHMVHSKQNIKTQWYT